MLDGFNLVEGFWLVVFELLFCFCFHLKSALLLPCALHFTFTFTFTTRSTAYD